MASLALAQRVADALAADPAVVAVALGGSQASGAAGPGSDVDLYVYSEGEPAPALREALTAASPRRELSNRFFEPGDEWVDAESGVHVDAMFRSPAWIEDELTRVLVRCEARVGYSTAFWHGVRVGRALFDRTGWYAGLRARAAAPYPEALVGAVVAKNHPLLRRNLSSYLHQLERAVARRDLVSVNHRAAAFLASFFDVLFALNRETHPGEKRLVVLAEARCPRRPPYLDRDVEAFLRAVAAAGPEVVERADALGEALDALLRTAALI